MQLPRYTELRYTYPQPWFYDQLTSGFRISNVSGFRILYQSRFRIPGFVTWRRHNATIIASRGDWGKFGDTTGGTALTKKMWMVGWVRYPGH